MNSQSSVRELSVAEVREEIRNVLGTRVFRQSRVLMKLLRYIYTSLGALLARRGSMDEAIAHLQKAVALDPDQMMAQSNLALALAATGKVEEAILHEERAAKLAGKADPAMLDFLGELYAKVGRYPDAVEVTSRALELSAQSNDRRALEELRKKLASYQSHARRN